MSRLVTSLIQARCASTRERLDLIDWVLETVSARAVGQQGMLTSPDIELRIERMLASKKISCTRQEMSWGAAFWYRTVGTRVAGTRGIIYYLIPCTPFYTTPSQIRDVVNFSPSTVASSLSQLEVEGLITRLVHGRYARSENRVNVPTEGVSSIREVAQPSPARLYTEAQVYNDMEAQVYNPSELRYIQRSPSVLDTWRVDPPEGSDN